MCRCKNDDCPCPVKSDKHTLKLRTADPWTGLFGVKTGEGKLTLGVRFPTKANPDGSPMTRVTGRNPETKLPTWDYVQDERDRYHVESMVAGARADRKEERKAKALAKARAATMKARHDRVRAGAMTLHDRVEIIRTIAKIETLPHEAAEALDNLRKI